MSNHPLNPGWQMYRFDQIAININDRIEPDDAEVEHYVGLEHLDSDSLKIRRWGDPSEVGATKLLFKSGDIIFGRRRVYQRKLAVAEFDGICSAHAMVLRPKTEVVLPEFLPFFMQSDMFMNRALEISVGSLSPTINWRTLAKQEFPLPPLAEQRRLAEVLWAAEDVRRQTQNAYECAWQTRIASYFELTQRGDYSGTLKKSSIGLIPPHWNVSTVGDALNIDNHFRKPISAAARETMQGSYPYFGPTGQLDSLNEYRLNGTFALIGEDGDHFLKNSIWSMTQLIQGKFNVNNHVHVIRGTEICSTEWFFHFFRHRDVRKWLTKQGAGRLKLKKGDLVQMIIILPPPEEQSYLVGILGEISKATDQLENRIAEADKVLGNLRDYSIGN